MKLTEQEIEQIKNLKDNEYWEKCEMNDNCIDIHYIYEVYHLYESPEYGGSYYYVSSIHKSCFEDLIELINRLN